MPAFNALSNREVAAITSYAMSEKDDIVQSPALEPSTLQYQVLITTGRDPPGVSDARPF